MSKIKGHYVAQMVIDFNLDDEEHGVLPYEELKSRMDNEMDQTLAEIISDEIFIGDEGTVKVTKQYFDLYKVEDKDGCTDERSG